MTHGDPARGGRHGDEGLRIGRVNMRPVLDFIDRAAAARTPFFVWYAPMMPHSPHNPPDRLLAHYRDKAPSLEVARYWAMCEWFDETVGQLLDHLDARGLTSETLVVFLADNGWIQDPTADRCAPRSKQSPYDGGLRTPVLVRRPGKVRPGVSDVPVSSVDVAPTVLAAAGVRAPEGEKLPGVDLLDDAAVAARPAVFGEVFRHDIPDLDRPAAGLRFRWVVEGDWKLIVPDPANEPRAAAELFDVARDPSESSDLAGREPGRVTALRRRLDGWWAGR
jgi:arylsulfatase A-like enzyme